MSKIREIPRTKGWHPSWFLPKQRCESGHHDWKGTILGFEDGPHQEHGVILTDDGVRISTPLTFDLYYCHD